MGQWNYQHVLVVKCLSDRVATNRRGCIRPSIIRWRGCEDKIWCVFPLTQEIGTPSLLWKNISELLAAPMWDADVISMRLNFVEFLRPAGHYRHRGRRNIGRPRAGQLSTRLVSFQ